MSDKSFIKKTKFLIIAKLILLPIMKVILNKNMSFFNFVDILPIKNKIFLIQAHNIMVHKFTVRT